MRHDLIYSCIGGRKLASLPIIDFVTLYTAKWDAEAASAIIYCTVFVLPADLAVDWVGNNLYWTELQHRRIVVQDLDTGQNSSLLQALADETFRSIALDPTQKYVPLNRKRSSYWSL